MAWDGESNRLRIRGTAAAILWGYRSAATLTSWSIVKVNGQWTLSARLGPCDRFQLRQTPLLFTAPRTGIGAHDGFWAWGIESLTVGPDRIVAHLGPPEQ